MIKQSNADPVAIIVAGLRLSIFLQPGVVQLTHVMVGVADRASGGPPAIVGDHDLYPSILVLDDQLQEQRQRISIKIAFIRLAVGLHTAISAITEDRAQRVTAWGQLIGYVVGLILKPVVVTGPTRCEIGITDAFTIQVKFVSAEAGGINAGGFQTGAYLKLGS